jgi:glyoxylase-like metal-dependent hydrolase (beta-lactamase superfamily II)
MACAPGDDGSVALDYLSQQPPGIGTGECVELATGVQWIRMPVNASLPSINIWLLLDGRGCSVIDTGLRSPKTLDAWRRIEGNQRLLHGLGRVICTHMHPDHAGMAGWLCEKYGAELNMTRLEYFTLRMLAGDLSRQAPASSVEFYRAAGLSEDALERYRDVFGDYGRACYPVPDAFRALTNGDEISIGGIGWRVISSRGHSPEHACFHCPTLNLLISGDQVLPQISSNVSVYPYEPETDPLTDWLAALRHLGEAVPAGVTVLPAHGQPFRGLHARIDALIRGHEQKLRWIYESICQKPARPADLFPVHYRRAIPPDQACWAAGETMAHLACLRTRGLAAVERCADGFRWWTGMQSS